MLDFQLFVVVCSFFPCTPPTFSFHIDLGHIRLCTQQQQQHSTVSLKHQQQERKKKKRNKFDQVNLFEYCFIQRHCPLQVTTQSIQRKCLPLSRKSWMQEKKKGKFSF